MKRKEFQRQKTKDYKAIAAEQLLITPDEFNCQLIRRLIWYNAEKQHCDWNLSLQSR